MSSWVGFDVTASMPNKAVLCNTALKRRKLLSSLNCGQQRESSKAAVKSQLMLLELLVSSLLKAA
ncbi:MAG: hypothetical protein ACKESB_02805 [Candidatus Hodgkinia cicadicola]